ncbi:DUF4244 domain-containing protein [Modestobacter sp. KNN46-3]|uniref:DUF4244 domain-containing protein n=1 Tax=Modestobacter sp. KNN46-3 TaxID=2711218 RepID=UPI0013DF54CE|nr:DUF4244 domain-containing protein [Modestobacter sp. KNN46-3]
MEIQPENEERTTGCRRAALAQRWSEARVAGEEGMSTAEYAVGRHFRMCWSEAPLPL